MAGKIEDYIQSEVKKYGTLCFPLIDSENFTGGASVAKKVEGMELQSVLVGGSSAIDQLELTEMVSSIKLQIKIPVILFPGNVTGVSPRADAILFSTLLNSEDPYFITEAQALGALSVKKYKIEPLPTGYLIIGEGTTAWFIGRARGIPFNKYRIAVMYSLAGSVFRHEIFIPRGRFGRYAKHLAPNGICSKETLRRNTYSWRWNSCS